MFKGENLSPQISEVLGIDEHSLLVKDLAVIYPAQVLINKIFQLRGYLKATYLSCALKFGSGLGCKLCY